MISLAPSLALRQIVFFVWVSLTPPARTFTASLNPNLHKILYLRWKCGSALDLLRQLALELDLVPAHYRGDLVRQRS